MDLQPGWPASGCINRCAREAALSLPRAGAAGSDCEPWFPSAGPGFPICWTVVGSVLAYDTLATKKHLCWAFKNLKTATFLASMNLPNVNSDGSK